MSDASSVIKEFLVRLGVTVDEQGIKRFSDGIGKVTKVIGTMATAVEAMALATFAAVNEVAEQFSDLYFAAQRIGSSVEDINAFGFAVSQLGGTADGAKRSLENMAEWVRSNPGGAAYLEALGVHLKYVHGQAQLSEQAVGDLADAFRNMPYPMAKQIATSLGIDDKTLKAMIADTRAFQAEYHQIAAQNGMDQDAAAKKAVEFARSINDLKARVGLLASELALRLAPAIESIVNTLIRLDGVTHGWSTGLAAAALALGPISLLLRPLVTGLVEAVGGLEGFGAAAAVVGEVLSGPVGWIAALVAGLAVLLARSQEVRDGVSQAFASAAPEVKAALADMRDAIDPLVQACISLGEVAVAAGRYLVAGLGPAIGPLVADGLKLITDGMHFLADVIRVVIDLLTLNWAKAWSDLGRVGRDMVKGMADQVQGLVGVVDGAVKGIQRLWYAATHHGQLPQEPAPRAAPAPARPNPAAAPAPAGDSSLPAGMRRNNPGNLRRWGDAPIEGGFAHFATAQDGLTAMAKNLIRYGQRGLDTVKAIISTWAPANENDTAAYIRSVSKQLGVGANQALNLADPATLQKLMHAITLHENGRDPYSSGLYGQAAASALNGAGRAPVQMSQKTDIHVHGAGDPQAAGRAVAGEQQRVNGNLIRNLKGLAS
ncbi:MAG: putative bacteriophage protein [Phenylobacterium sp.]|nr:putative bacteriophage protein [Phenylobacterium sp.]